MLSLGQIVGEDMAEEASLKVYTHSPIRNDALVIREGMVHTVLAFDNPTFYCYTSLCLSFSKGWHF